MVFSSATFLLAFLPAVIFSYYIIKNRTYRNIILLFASLLFYAWGEPLFVFIMIFSVVFNWFIGLFIGKNDDKKRRKLWLSIAIIFDTGLLFVFKYLSFIAENIGLILNKNINLVITLPIGISFFTFQIMSYIFDVYYKKVPIQKNIINLALYITMFPQLVAGPIVRYTTIEYEINNRVENRKDFTQGLKRFVYGLGKKVLIANYVALIADNIFAMNTSIVSTMSAWLGAIAYTMQIYFDFSGYSDMAIGMGLIFGFHFDENFNYPYSAKSVTDFWRRWHISLSSWFRDYVYIPLGGNRVSKPRWVFNLFAVWLLTGIWHGANWTFIFWGIAYFVILITEKLTNFPKKLHFFSHIYTMVFVVILWVVFRANSLSEAFAYIKNMFLGGYKFADSTFNKYINDGKFVLLAGAVLGLPVIPALKSAFSKIYKRADERKKRLYVIALDFSRAAFIVAVFVLCITVCEKSTYNPFIYFNF